MAKIHASLSYLTLPRLLYKINKINVEIWFAPLRFAPLRFAPLRFAPFGFAPVIFAP